MFSAILATITTLPVDARVNVNNSSRSYADAYNQVNMLRYQQEYMAATEAAAADNLPVMVSDEKLASEIANNTSEVTVADLDSCAMIWPNGTFKWEVPESGIRHNPMNQCVAVISLIDGTTKEVLATTTVAAGDTIKCNIDYFPESGMNKIAVEKTELPADAAPTMEDVEAVMNKEQKQNAGIKIAATAIIGGLAGNLLSNKEAGDTKMLGYKGDRIRDTAIGAAAGAGVMAASTYSGKVAGDTITSTAVNAASGMVIGNMLAGFNGGGDGYLEIEKCQVTDMTASDFAGERDCIKGKIREKGEPLSSHTKATTTETDKEIFYLVNEKGKAKKCVKAKGNYDETWLNKDKVNIMKQQKLQCNEDIELANIYVFHIEKESVALSSVKNSDFSELVKYYLNTDDNLYTYFEDGVKDTQYFLVKQANAVKNSQPAYIVFQNSVPKNIKGYKKSDFEKELAVRDDIKYFKRNNDGTVGSVIDKEDKKLDFSVFDVGAEDGGLIDISNKARVGGTLAGTATGGALGGFAGYQGAKSDITNRWTTAVREYEDSLSNFGCMSGTRYLGKYNDYVEVHDLNKTE